MYRRVRTPIGRQTTDCFINLFSKSQQIANHPPLQQRAIPVRVRQMRGHQLHCPKLIEDHFSNMQLVVREAAQVKNGEGINSRKCIGEGENKLAESWPGKGV